MHMEILKETAPLMSLLYVEDDAEIRENLGRLLSRLFKETVTAENGREALELYKQRKFDLVLTDINMPVMDGLEFIREVRKLDGVQPIMVSSARHDDSGLLLDLVNCSVSGFMPKPFDWEKSKEVLATVCQWTHERQMLMHYLGELEKQHENALSVSCKTQCPMKEALSPPKNEGDEDEDDFLFFPEPSAEQSDHDDDIYRDYFEFLQADDREELKDVLDDIDASLLSAFGPGGIAPEYVIRLGSAFSQYGNVLIRYQFFSDMGMVILELGTILAEKSGSLAERANELQIYLSGFCSVLQTFMAEVWEKNSENPKFFNDSIKNDAGIIMGLIAPPPADDGDDGLMFF